MASPQLENGFTKISNEILEALSRTELIGSHFCLILAILRKTYGFNKKEDRLSISQLVELLSVSRRTIIYNLQDLEAKKIILVKRVKKGAKNEVNIISFNKDHESWQTQNSSPQVEKNRGSAKLRKQLKQGVVQNFSKGSAKLRKGVVQNFSKGSANSLHPQYKTKERETKETKEIAAGTANTEENTLSGSLLSVGEIQPKEIVAIMALFHSSGLAALPLAYGNKTERSAVSSLLSSVGYKQLVETINGLAARRKEQFFPMITKPTQLERKYSEARIFLEKRTTAATSAGKPVPSALNVDLDKKYGGWGESKSN